MKARFLAAMLLLGAAPAAPQSGSVAEAERMIAQLQAAHVDAHVPDASRFSQLLERDLNAYFAASGVADPVVRYELLRQGPTQSGIGYPKFYLWVRVSSAGQERPAGAVRAAAIERRAFRITDFLTADEIRAEPDRVGSIFPAPLVDAIRERAGLSSPAR